MKRTLAVFETTVMMVLVALMALAIAAATLDLVWVFVTGLLSAPFDFLTVNELLDVFGLFLVVLIGLELMETVKTFLTEQRIHVEAVLLVALIAIARKVILLDLKALSAQTLFAVAAIILALAGGYYLIRKAGSWG